MSAILTIAGREVRSLLTSSLGWVVLAFFLFVSGFFFIAPLAANIANLRYVTGNTTIWLAFLLPALTMRLLAEEKKQGTIELLMTSPVTETQVVLGKYLGVLAYYGVIIFSMMQYVFVMGLVRKSGANPIFPAYTGLILNAASLVVLAIAAVKECKYWWLAAGVLAVSTFICAGFSAAQMGEWGPAFTGFLGLFMIGAVFLAIGLLASGLTRNQIIAWVSTAAVLLVLIALIPWLPFLANPSTPPDLPANANFGDYLGMAWNWLGFILVKIIQTVNLQQYLQNFAQGVLDLRDFVLYLSVIAVSLFFAVRGLAVSRWS